MAELAEASAEVSACVQRGPPPPPGPAPALTSVGGDKLWAQIVMHQKNR